MCSSLLRFAVAVGFAFACGAAQAGLVVFDSTNGLDTGRINGASNNFTTNHGVQFQVANGVNFSLESIYFAVGSSHPSLDRDITFSVNLFEVGNATPLATASGVYRVPQRISAEVKSVTVIGFNDLKTWSLSGGKSYAVQMTSGCCGGFIFMAETSQTNLTENFVSFERFVKGGNVASANYWIQLTANDASVVPEPATIGLLVGGLGIGLGRCVRRRSRRTSTTAASKSAAAFSNPLRRLKAALSR